MQRNVASERVCEPVFWSLSLAVLRQRDGPAPSWGPLILEWKARIVSDGGQSVVLLDDWGLS